ncbi:MAG: hypothetical protein JO164_09615 [Candidatus Eremiobacteraeota bacterium]|nr:hypothetical protein [Candidatus Eremiobacteraeota bacterium]
MEGITRLWWVLVPAWAARLSRALAYAIGDGAELAAIPLAGLLLPPAAFVVGFLCARLVPGTDSAFTGALALTCAMLVVGAICGGAGWWCVVGFALGDATSGHHPFLQGPVNAVVALAVSYALLFALVVGVPRLARALAASLTPRAWVIPRALLAAVFGAGLAYTWAQSAPILIRPLFMLSHEQPSSEMIQPTQAHPGAYALVAALAIGIFALLRAPLAASPAGAHWILAGARARAAAANVVLPWPLVAALRALATTIFLAGLSSGLVESVAMFVVLTAIFALNEILGMRRTFVRIVTRIPVALRYAACVAAAFAAAWAIVLPLFYGTVTFEPLLYAIAASFLAGAILFPPTRRVAAIVLFVLVALPTVALADNCSGLGDCFSAGEWAAIAAAAVALAVLGGFALAAAAAAEGAEIAAAAAAAGEAEAAAAAGEGALAAGELGVTAAEGGEVAAAGEAGAAAAGEAGETAALAGEGEATAGEIGATTGEAGEAGAADAGAAGSPPTPGAVQSTSGYYPDFNPSGCNTNCGACADAVENGLAGNGINPAAAGTQAWPTTGGPLQYPLAGGAGDVEAALQAAGDGSRGIAYVTDGTYAHVFNAVNDGGTIVAIDGQAGVYGTVSDVAGYSGYSGSGLTWGFIPTFPP